MSSQTYGPVYTVVEKLYHAYRLGETEKVNALLRELFWISIGKNTK